MNKIEQTTLSLKNEIKFKNPQELLNAMVVKFGNKIAFSSSFSAEDQVVLDMLTKLVDKPKVFTLDTGRLPEQTFAVIEASRRRYGVDIEILFPNAINVEKMVNELGPNLFYESIDNRKMCCRIRKIEPLKRKLANLDAWICGLRSEQSTTRTKLEQIEADYNFGLVKISPLADWTTKQVWDYIKENNVPYNKLHDEGYPSIGCACCTRSVKDGEDFRSGRWWWESPEHKECGLHLKTKDTKG